MPEKTELIKQIIWLESTKSTWCFLSLIMFIINLITVPYAVLYILEHGFKL